MKPVAWFINSTGVLLTITSVAKYVSSLGDVAILQTHDPLTGLQFRYLFWIAATVELVIALFCFFCKRIFLTTGLIAWLSSCFLLYRICLILVGYVRPCSCLGNFSDALHISPQTANTVMKTVLAYLLIGSYVSLFWLWRQPGTKMMAR